MDGRIKDFGWGITPERMTEEFLFAREFTQAVAAGDPDCIPVLEEVPYDRVVEWATNRVVDHFLFCDALRAD